MDKLMKQRHVLYRLLSYTKPHKKVLTIAFILLFIGTAGQVLGPVLIKIFIDDYLTPRYLPFDQLFWLGTTYLIIHVSSVIVTYFQLYLFQKTALKIIQQIRVDVFSKVQHLGMKFFDRVPGGSLVSRITNDTEAVKELFVNVLSTFIQSSVFLIGIFIAMFALNVKLAAVCLILIPIIYSIMYTYRRLSSKFYYTMREKLSELNAKLSESMQGMVVVQMLRQEKRLRREFSIINKEHYEAGMKNLKLDGLLLRPATDLLLMLSLILILSFFGFQSFQSPIEIGVLFAFVNYLDRFFEPVNQVMMRLSIYQQAIVSASRVFNLMDEKETAPAALSNKAPAIQNGEVEFKNVSFSYDGKNDVLKNVSFKVKPGETLALVGHTGSGKSSIINLLMRFYDTYKGEIFIDGVSLRDFENEELRRKMGLVLQDPFVFVGDIYENIRLYNKQISDEEVVEAAAFVQADKFINKLPEKFHHVVGERGSTFSSGQRQLLAFARTMVMKPKILVLDEATANIDTETEEAIQAALGKMRQGRTTIAIAHRFSTIQDADNILVLHQGRIVESGNHQLLLSHKGLYYKMYLLQYGKVEKVDDII
jgi:ATP-binding cassette subfamily B multidrug efflux pump